MERRWSLEEEDKDQIIKTTDDGEMSWYSVKERPQTKIIEDWRVVGGWSSMEERSRTRIIGDWSSVEERPRTIIVRDWSSVKERPRTIVGESKGDGCRKNLRYRRQRESEKKFSRNLGFVWQIKE
jgi:hypothetical protein